MSAIRHAHTSVFLISITSGGVMVSRAELSETGTVFSNTVTKTFSAPTDAPLNVTLTALTTTLESCITDLSTKNGSAPKHILVTIGTPWIVSQTRQIVYRQATPFLVSKDTIENLVQKEIEYVTKHDMEQFAGFGAQMNIVEKRLSTILLNGYETAKPFGKHASSLDMMLTISVAPQEIIDRLNDTIRRHYGTRPIQHVSAVLGAFTVLRDQPDAPTDAWIADISETTTDITFIKNGSLLYHHTIPLGTTAITSNPAQLAAADADVLHEKDEKNLRATVDQATTTWLTEVEKVFDTHAYGLCAPAHGYLIADANIATIFESAIRQNEFIKHACGGAPITTDVLTSEKILPHSSPASASTVPIRIALASVFAARSIE